MLTNHRKPVRLSLISTDLPIWSVVQTAATLYQKDGERFHLLFTEPPVQEQQSTAAFAKNSRLLWLEISPYRVVMTMQATAQLSYRHFWEQGIYGTSRYWLQSESMQSNEQIRLRNFTRHLSLVGRPLPQKLQVEYELWSAKVQLGRYILNLEIQH
ncbi:hypothetical protein [Chroococcidiopsis sp. CCMEE 29]|uniref:hypothetical protein n=1 Tax=Chroococcidiopsis sp. CCMEE 29 TaxID=155894 RepID=UPI002020250F|nr:hypothetical protein [Chroococcidiopsis sp. CCMEE 29]